MKLQTAHRSSKGLVKFDDHVIGGKVMDGQEGVGNVRLAGTAAMNLRRIDQGRMARSEAPAQVERDLGRQRHRAEIFKDS